MKVKAKGILVLQNGEVIRVTNTYRELQAFIAQQFKAGSALEYMRVTDHGTGKLTTIPVGMVVRIEEP